MKTALIIACLLCSAVMHAQLSIEREVLSSNGGYETNGTLSLEWTLGEMSTSHSSNGNLIISEGYEQASDEAVGVEELAAEYGLNIFPNPSVEEVYITRSVNGSEAWQVQLSDVKGKVVLSETIPTSENRFQLHLQDLATGSYYLQLSEGDRIIQYKKIVKLDR